MNGKSIPRGDATVLQIGHWRFDSRARYLTDGIRKRRLTSKAASVLAALAEADGHVVIRAELLDRVWPDSDVGDEVLTQSVTEIRRAMGDGRTRRIIETVHGTGYRLDSPARSVSADMPIWSDQQADDFDLDAYLDFSEARRLCEREGERALAQATELCGAAVARAPRCPLILSEFASLAAMRHLYAEGSGGPALEEVLSVAEAAADIGPHLACGHMSRGVVLAALDRRPEACRAFNHAITCDPLDFQAHYHYARALFALGDFSRAARMAECAASLRIDDYRPFFVAATSWSALGKRRRARAASEAGLARLRQQFALGCAGSRTGSALGLFLALRGDHEDAYRSIAEHEGKQDSMLYYGVAAYAALGETDTALDRLERIVDHGFRHADWLNADPTLEPLRRLPRYRRVTASLNSAR